MMNWIAAILLITSLAGSSAYLQREKVLKAAVIFLPGGGTQNVWVDDGRSYYCPAFCQVNHRHRVHTVQWHCPDGVRCTHFVVRHVILYPGDPLPADAPAALAGANPSPKALADQPEPRR